MILLSTSYPTKADSIVRLLHFLFLGKSAPEPFFLLRHRMGKEAPDAPHTATAPDACRMEAIAMNPFWISFFHIFFLCAAVCVDTFAAAFGFGIDQIRIPAPSALVLSLVCSSALALSILAAGWLAPYLPDHLTSCLSCALLCGLGLFKLFDSVVKRLVRRLPQPGKELSFSFLRMRFLLRVWADPPRPIPIVPVSCRQPNPSRWLSLCPATGWPRAGWWIFRPFPMVRFFLFRGNEPDLYPGRLLCRKKGGKTGQF